MDLKERNKQHLDLSISNFNRIKSVFEQNGWPIYDRFGEDTFGDFCNMFAGFEEDQFEMMISLTERFLWVNENDYPKYFIDAFNKFINSFCFENEKNIMLCPLLPEDDFGKSKSSVFLFYMIKSHFNYLKRKYNISNLKKCDLPPDIDVDRIKDKYVLCLIDDFIGTGETVERAIDYFLLKGYPKEHIVILSLVAMKSGVQRLKEQQINIYNAIICDKGLSSKGDEKQIELMNKIETQIGVEEDFLFGYKGSEALVKMYRTPNNTFPVYWLRNKKNSYAPFPR